VTLPRTADIVIIGGGVMGASIAFHLARMGGGKVVLLERKHLAAGATGPSSALVRMHYDNPLEAEIALKSLETFQHFDDIVGDDCGWVCTGFLHLAQPIDFEPLKANVAMMQGLGINTSLVTRDEIREMAPYLNTDEPMLGAYEPDSGYADPHMTTMGFANGARRHGAQVFQNTEVIGIGVDGGRVTGVQTSRGDIAAPIVVNAAGPWGGLVAAMAGITIDLTILHHQAGVVEAPPEAPWPHLTIIDAIQYFYFRPETGRLTLVGASFANRIIGIDQLDTYSENLTYETRNAMLERFCARFPAMEVGAVRKGHAGIYVNTRDGHALMGPAPGVEGFYFATGLSGHGFKEAPAFGQAMAELVLNGRAEVADITPLRVTRFEEGQPYEGLHPYVEWPSEQISHDPAFLHIKRD